MKNNDGIFILVWNDEEEKFYYFKEKFDETQFKNGCVDYEVTVKNNIIIEDTLNISNTGKLFSISYDINLWEKVNTLENYEERER